MDMGELYIIAWWIQLINMNRKLEFYSWYSEQYKQLIVLSLKGKYVIIGTLYFNKCRPLGGTFYFFSLVRNPSGNSSDHGRSRFRSSGFGKGPFYEARLIHREDIYTASDHSAGRFLQYYKQLRWHLPHVYSWQPASFGDRPQNFWWRAHWVIFI